MKKILIICSLLGIVVIAIASVYLLKRTSAGITSNKSVAEISNSKDEITKKTSSVKAVSANAVPLPPTAGDQDKVIQDIRRQLQDVMDLNAKINSVQQSKSTQLLRIQDQASIHQKILADIQKTASVKVPVLPSREALLAQEKLRIIREETLRNKKILEDRTSSKTILKS